MTDAKRSPYFNMIKRNDDTGNCEIVIKPSNNIARRQDVPTVYDMTTVAYVANTKFVMTSQNIFDGVVKMVHVPPERAIDIDTQFDFDIAEYLFMKKQI